MNIIIKCREKKVPHSLFSLQLICALSLKILRTSEQTHQSLWQYGLSCSQDVRSVRFVFDIFFSAFPFAMRKGGCCSLVRSKIQDRRNKYNKLKKRPFLRFYPVIAKVPDNRKRIEIWAVSGELWARCREWCCLLWKERFIVIIIIAFFSISQHRIRLSAEYLYYPRTPPLIKL